MERWCGGTGVCTVSCCTCCGALLCQRGRQPRRRHVTWGQRKSERPLPPPSDVGCRLPAAVAMRVIGRPWGARSTDNQHLSATSDPTTALHSTRHACASRPPCEETRQRHQPSTTSTHGLLSPSRHPLPSYGQQLCLDLCVRHLEHCPRHASSANRSSALHKEPCLLARGLARCIGEACCPGATSPR